MIKSAITWALGASAVTAYLFQLVFKNAGAQRELLEGVTMLLAAGVMFSMSYWMLAKAEAERWKAYIKQAVSGSLSKGSAFGLWAATFLAVYREGAETILFYAALAHDAQSTVGSLLPVDSVLDVGACRHVYGIMRYSMLKIPLRPFFQITGGFHLLHVICLCRQWYVGVNGSKGV